METELRRCRSELGMLGAGVIAFLIWELLKPILIVLLIRDSPASGRTAEMLEGLSTEVLVTILVTLFVLGLLNVFLRVWVGTSARAEAAGRRRGRAYVVFAFVLFVLQSAEFVQGVLQMFLSGLTGTSPLEAVASLMVELSSVWIMGELAFTAAKVRRLSRPKNG